jgi:hypothetical protein
MAREFAPVFAKSVGGRRGFFSGDEKFPGRI